MIGSYKAIGIAPFASEFLYNDSAAGWLTTGGAYKLIRSSKTPKFQASSPITNTEVTVASFKNLWKYGAIVISSHGLLDEIAIQLDNGTVIETYGVSILLNEEATDYKKEVLYKGDIDSKRIYFTPDINGKEYFIIWPGYFNTYARNMPNSLVYLALCYGLGDAFLKDAFYKNGAGAVVGFDSAAYISYMFDIGNKFTQSMIDGKNVIDSLKDAKDKHGNFDGTVQDENGKRAQAGFYGKQNLVLEFTGIRNGSFEDELNFWQSNGGDVRFINRLASLNPQEGDKMAIISTGLGSTTDSDAILSQQFKIPSYVSTLSFAYDVVSEEPMEFVNSGYDDKFLATLVTENGDEIILASETVNSSSWHKIAGSMPDGGMFDGGDGTTYHTGWKHIQYNVTPYIGQSVTLKFHVWDVGDSAYDTAAVIDNALLY